MNYQEIEPSSTLPSTYQEVEYIESSGTQWIDTGIYATQDTMMQFKFMNLSVTGNVILGLQNNDDKTDYRFFNASSYIYFDFGSSRIYGSNCYANTLYEFEFGNYYVKNVGASTNILTGTAISSYTSPRTITINNYCDSSYSSNRVYYLKIYDSSTLVRNFVPCYRKSDSTVGLYDLVSNTFFTNQGTGTFSKGSDAGTSTITPTWDTTYQLTSYASSLTINSPTSTPANTTKRICVKYKGDPALTVPSDWRWNCKPDSADSGYNEIILNYDSVDSKINAVGACFKGVSIEPIFYAPLTYNDLTDHVSGNTFTTKDSTIAWDSSIGMYKFMKSGSGSVRCTGLNLGLPFTSSSYSNVNATMLYDILLTSETLTTNYACFLSLSYGFESSISSGSLRFPHVRYNFFMDGSTRTSFRMSTNTLYHMAYVISNGVFSLYINGNLVDYTFDIDSFDYTTCNSVVSMCGGSWSGNNGGGYYKNIQIYDHVLTAAKIKEIQGIN